MTRLVSVTSMAVERDSRTFKMAASAARLGYESIVVEGVRSSLDPASLPFRLLSPDHAPGATAASEPAAEAEPGAAKAAEAEAEPAPEPLRTRVRSAIGRRVPPRIADPFRKRLWQFQESRGTLRSYRDDYRRRNRIVETILPDADIYWLHSFFQFPSVYRRCRRLGARLLYDSPDAYWEEGQMEIAGGRVGRAAMRFYDATEKRAARRAEQYTTVSEGVAGLMERRFGRRPLVIRNAHDLRLDVDPPEDIRAAAGIPADAFLLVMTGNLKDGMTVREGLTALRELPASVHLAFVGRNHDRSAGLVRDLGLEGRAHLLKPVPPTEVVRFIASADASPILYRAQSASYLNALPNGFFHAVAAGLPILYPPLPEIRGLCRKYELGLEIAPEQPDTIVAGVRSLIEDESARRRYRASAERAREVLNWEHEEGLIADLLEGTATLPGRSTGPAARERMGS